ncbi:hypothetical protein [Oryzibacter oryziterrae]|uniref:hypothetical protein n=1 Tax=Oryzibacter oryziterrae TaxID=2766474 RepID=UPI001F1EA039|nr:hypothetical protein [Oryzibacter oryziterrae]
MILRLLALASLNLALGGMLITRFALPSAEVERAAPTRLADTLPQAGPTAPSLSLPTEPSLSERHLFAPLPVAEEPVAEEPQDVAPPPDLKLVGVINGTGTTVALIRLPDESTLRAWVGQDVAGWTVVAISNHAVILTDGNQRHEYQLDPPETEAQPSEDGQ